MEERIFFGGEGGGGRKVKGEISEMRHKSGSDFVDRIEYFCTGYKVFE